jgi:hypothetical protein
MRVSDGDRGFVPQNVRRRQIVERRGSGRPSIYFWTKPVFTGSVWRVAVTTYLLTIPLPSRFGRQGRPSVIARRCRITARPQGLRGVALVVRHSRNISVSLTGLRAPAAQEAQNSLPLAQNRKRLAAFWFAIDGGRFSP